MSRRAGSPLTVTVASTLEIFICVLVSVFCPTETFTSGFVTKVKPWSSYLRV